MVVNINVMGFHPNIGSKAFCRSSTCRQKLIRLPMFNFIVCEMFSLKHVWKYIYMTKVQTIAKLILWRATLVTGNRSHYTQRRRAHTKNKRPGGLNADAFFLSLQYLSLVSVWRLRPVNEIKRKWWTIFSTERKDKYKTSVVMIVFRLGWVESWIVQLKTFIYGQRFKKRATYLLKALLI